MSQLAERDGGPGAALFEWGKGSGGGVTATLIDEMEERPAEAPESPTENRGLARAVQGFLAKHPQLEWVVLLALAAAMVAQMWTSVVQLSITSDEIDHLHAAYRYWQCNDFGWNPEHPPLVKIVAGLPLQFMRINDPIARACGLPNSKAEDFIVGHAFIFANREGMLTAARFAVSIFSILLLLTVWFFARRMFGLPVAIICGVFIAFDPNILAHGALVTTDVAAGVGFLLAVYALYCYVSDPTPTRLLAVGLAAGFAFSVKHSAILLTAILPSLMIIDAIVVNRRQRVSQVLLRYTGALVAIAAIAVTVLWASYGFHYAARPGGADIWSPPMLDRATGTVATKLIPEVRRLHVLPEAYLAGLQDVLVESEVGRSSFLFGRLYRQGNWFYFPVAAVVKFTLPFFLMLLMSALSWRYWRSKRRELLFLILPSMMYLVFSMRSNLNIGTRHLMPVLGLLLIFAAAGAWAISSTRKWSMIALLALLSWQVLTSIRAYPNYLSYSNELWGGPSQTYRYLANSDVDWGQAQKMARAYITKTHPENCFFLRTYNNKNTDYDIPCGGISEIQWDQLQTPYTGTMIVSGSMVDGVGVRGIAVQTRRVFKDLKPAAKLGGSALLVYQGTFDISPLVAAQLVLRARTEGDADPQRALTDSQQAVALDALNGDAHVAMCASYMALGETENAEEECNLGLELVRKDPQYGPEQIKRLEDFIVKKGLKVYGKTAPQ